MQRLKLVTVVLTVAVAVPAWADPPQAEDGAAGRDPSIGELPSTSDDVESSTEEDAGRDQTQLAALAFETDGLTPMYYWAPTGAVALKSAAACRDASWDYYGIAVIFRVTTPQGQKDQLWYLVIDGLSSWSTYGKLVATYKVYEAADLRTVDCATDGRNAYVAWDSFTNTPGTIDRAFWARLRVEQNAGSPYVRKWGPYQVGNGVGCLQYDPGATYAGRPRIAYEPGGHVLVVFAQLSPWAGPNGCPLCTETFVGTTGELIWWDDIWAQGNETSFDVEWAVNAFIILRLFRLDGADTGDYMSTTVGSDGSIIVEHQWLTSTGDYYPTDDARLVYTPNARNPNYQTIGMVDSRNFWLYGNGMLSGSKNLYRTDWVGCEYWGPNPRTSQVYSVYYPNSALVHDHTPTMAGTALDSYSFTSRIPLACSSSEVFTDQEVLLVVGFAGLARVYWNFEPED